MLANRKITARFVSNKPRDLLDSGQLYERNTKLFLSNLLQQHFCPKSHVERRKKAVETQGGAKMFRGTKVLDLASMRRESDRKIIFISLGIET